MKRNWQRRRSGSASNWGKRMRMTQLRKMDEEATLERLGMLPGVEILNM